MLGAEGRDNFSMQPTALSGRAPRAAHRGVRRMNHHPSGRYRFGYSGLGRCGLAWRSGPGGAEAVNGELSVQPGHALSLELTFVTNNTRHFGRGVGFKTENWV